MSIQPRICKRWQEQWRWEQRNVLGLVIKQTKNHCSHSSALLVCIYPCTLRLRNYRISEFGVWPAFQLSMKEELGERRPKWFLIDTWHDSSCKQASRRLQLAFVGGWSVVAYRSMTDDDDNVEIPTTLPFLFHAHNVHIVHRAFSKKEVGCL